METNKEFYKYAESLGIKINDAQRLMMLANKVDVVETNKITADEILKQSFEGYHPSQYNDLHKIQKDRIKHAMIEFARIKVTEALKEAAENAFKIYEEHGFTNTGDKVKQSILNYDLNQIK